MLIHQYDAVTLTTMTIDAASAFATVDTVLFFAFIVEWARIGRIGIALGKAVGDRYLKTGAVFVTVVACVDYLTSIGFLLAVLEGSTDPNVFMVAWASSGLFLVGIIVLFVRLLFMPRIAEPIRQFDASPAGRSDRRRIAAARSLHPARPSRAARRRRSR
jgi:hypothetical protein